MRAQNAKGIFDKGHAQRCTDEVFIIEKIRLDAPVMYYLKDWHGENVSGGFYEHELTPVIKTDQDLWDIEKIIKTRVRNKKKEYFVRFRAHGPAFDQWVTDIHRKKNI